MHENQFGNKGSLLFFDRRIYLDNPELVQLTIEPSHLILKYDSRQQLAVALRYYTCMCLISVAFFLSGIALGYYYTAAITAGLIVFCSTALLASVVFTHCQLKEFPEEILRVDKNSGGPLLYDGRVVLPANCRITLHCIQDRSPAYYNGNHYEASFSDWFELNLEVNRPDGVQVLYGLLGARNEKVCLPIALAIQRATEWEIRRNERSDFDHRVSVPRRGCD